MNRRDTRISLAALILGAALALALAAQAAAQYPPRVGNVAVEVADATPAVGADVTITATVLDEDGNLAAGVDCTFSVAEQPGSDAAVEVGPFTTDADGTVSTTLATGSTAGTIVVEADCGELSAAVTIVAGAAAGPSGPAQPPASLPDTGSGGEPDATWPALALVLAALAVGGGGIAIAWRMLKT